MGRVDKFKKDMNFKKGSIGVFDSGFGGLNILKSILKKNSDYDFLYLGDTARVPYGTRSQGVVYEFTKQAVDFLFNQNCKLIILACNTASAEALKKIQQEYLPIRYPQKRVLGVIVPTVEEAVEATKNGRIGVIATEGTVISGAFEKELVKRNPRVKVFSQAAPLIVPLIESSGNSPELIGMILKNYLEPLMKKNIDTLILGCTHYEILENEIRKIVGKKITVLSEGEIVAEKLANYLERHPEIEIELNRNSKRKFYTTDLTDKFVNLGSKFLGEGIKAQKIILN